jgi:hypothetical protein
VSVSVERTIRQEVAEVEAEMALMQATIPGYDEPELTEHLRSFHALAVRRVRLLTALDSLQPQRG